MSNSSSSRVNLILFSPWTSVSPKLTKLNSSSESNSEQNDDSKDGFSDVNDSSAEAVSVMTPPKAILCSSSSVDNVGRGGQTDTVVATTAAGENDPEVRSRRLTNSATGANEADDSGDDAESEGDVQPDKGLASAESGKICN